MANYKTHNMLGLISGSSLDGLDVALCSFTFDKGRYLESWAINYCTTLPFTDAWQQKLSQVAGSSGEELIRTDVDFGHYIGRQVTKVIQENDLKPDCIASHGHTVFHSPGQGYTLQIGDGAAIVAETGFPVIDRFRNMDVALGGEGAPLAPIADAWLFTDNDLFLNIGGIANLSCRTKRGWIAFDLTGANQVLNGLAHTVGRKYDKDGALASEGAINANLLNLCRSEPYLALSYPKSLSNKWVREKQIEPILQYDCPVRDKLHTFCQFIAEQVVDAVIMIKQKEDIGHGPLQLVVTGGGALNGFLMKCLSKEAKEPRSNFEPIVPDKQLVEFKEAALIALMGALWIENIPNCLSTVTGARSNVIGGTLHRSWLHTGIKSSPFHPGRTSAWQSETG